MGFCLCVDRHRSRSAASPIYRLDSALHGGSGDVDCLAMAGPSVAFGTRVVAPPSAAQLDGQYNPFLADRVGGANGAVSRGWDSYGADAYRNAPAGALAAGRRVADGGAGCRRRSGVCGCRIADGRRLTAIGHGGPIGGSIGGNLGHPELRLQWRLCQAAPRCRSGRFICGNAAYGGVTFGVTRRPVSGGRFGVVDTREELGCCFRTRDYGYRAGHVELLCCGVGARSGVPIDDQLSHPSSGVLGGDPVARRALVCSASAGFDLNLARCRIDSVAAKRMRTVQAALDFLGRSAAALSGVRIAPEESVQRHLHRDGQ